MPSDPGLSVKDLRLRSGIPEIKRTDKPASPLDPIEGALDVRRRLTAQRIMDQTVAEVDASATEAENTRLKAQIEQRQLKEQVDGKAQPGFQEYMLQKLDETQKQLTEAQQRMAEKETEALRTRLDLLTDALERMQAADPQEELERRIEGAQRLLAKVTPTSPPEHSEDPALRAYELRTTLEHERWKLDHERQHEEKASELEDQRAFRARELDLQERHYQRLDRFMTETAPGILDTLKTLLTNWGKGTTGTPQVAPQSRPDHSANVPAGVLTMQCQQCGALMYYRPEYPGVICGQCGAEYTDDQATTAPAETGATIHPPSDTASGREGDATEGE